MSRIYKIKQDEQDKQTFLKTSTSSPGNLGHPVNPSRISKIKQDFQD